jgi:two-component system response regulator PilR (NtrC family)
MSRKTRGQPKVLVVDDEPDLLELLEMTLSRMGLDTSRASPSARRYGCSIATRTTSA